MDTYYDVGCESGQHVEIIFTCSLTIGQHVEIRSRFSIALESRFVNMLRFYVYVRVVNMVTTLGSIIIERIHDHLNMSTTLESKAIEDIGRI